MSPDNDSKSWWIAAKREGFTQLGQEKAQSGPLDPSIEAFLEHIDRQFSHEMKEGWVADPSKDDEETL